MSTPTVLPFEEADEDADDIEGGVGAVDDPFCPSVNGLGPHNYQVAHDVLGGTGMWLICTQCGDFFQMDGTALPAPPIPGLAPGTPPPAAPAPAPAPGRTPFP